MQAREQRVFMPSQLNGTNIKTTTRHYVTFSASCKTPGILFFRSPLRVQCHEHYQLWFITTWLDIWLFLSLIIHRLAILFTNILHANCKATDLHGKISREKNTMEQVWGKCLVIKPDNYWLAAFSRNLNPSEICKIGLFKVLAPSSVDKLYLVRKCQ